MKSASSRAGAVPEFPIRAVIVGGLAMLLIAIVSAGTTWVVGKRLRTITNSQMVVLMGSERLQSQSEIAEISIEAAIASGDPSYARRYAESQPQRSETLRILGRAIEMPENRAALLRVQAAEREIAKRQFHALDLAMAGQNESARQVLVDPTYAALVQIFRSGLASIQARSRDFVAATRVETNRYLAINLATSLAALLILGVAWIVVVRPARQWGFQLADARRRAENATRAKGDFLAVMSHEIRTPLNSIIGFADLLNEDRALCDEQRRQVGLIQSAGNMLLTVVNDLLDFSKIEARRIELVPEPFALETLIDNSVSIVRGTAEAKGLDLRVAIDPSLSPYLRGDEDRLRQVLLNLLNNAVKFTAKGFVALSVEKAGDERDGERIRFSVSDTGPGVEPQRHKQLFRPFFQADASITRRYGGTGLGLSISKRLIELMGGRIDFESEPGAGSTFWFLVTLPRAAKPDTLGRSAAPSTTASGAHILLVEDLPMNQEMAKAMLIRAGHSVDIAGDGEVAVRRVQEERYDLVLMDIQMPKMDGITATRLIRLLPGAPSKLPILAMTANVLPAQVKEFLAAGMDGHIAKPVRQAELDAAIGAAIGPRAAEAAEVNSDSPADAILFDEAAFAEVREMLPPDRLRGHVENLSRDAVAVAEAAERLGRGSEASEGVTQAREIVVQGAHKIVSQAGMLGLLRLSNAARSLEQAIRQDQDVTDVRDRFRAAAGDPALFLAPRMAAGQSANQG